MSSCDDRACRPIFAPLQIFSSFFLLVPRPTISESTPHPSSSSVFLSHGPSFSCLRLLSLSPSLSIPLPPPTPSPFRAPCPAQVGAVLCSLGAVLWARCSWARCSAPSSPRPVSALGRGGCVGSWAGAPSAPRRFAWLESSFLPMVGHLRKCAHGARGLAAGDLGCCVTPRLPAASPRVPTPAPRARTGGQADRRGHPSLRSARVGWPGSVPVPGRPVRTRFNPDGLRQPDKGDVECDRAHRGSR